MHWFRITLAVATLAVCADAATPGKRKALASDDPDVVQSAEERLESVSASDYDAAIEASRVGLRRAEELGNRAQQMHFLRNLAYDCWIMGKLERAIDYCNRLRSLAEEEQSDLTLSRAHRILAVIFESLGDHERSRTHAAEALALARKINHRSAQMFALGAVARGEMHAGNFEVARRHFTTVADYWRRRNPWIAANTRRNFAELAALQGDLDQSVRLYRQSIDALESAGDRRGLARTCYILAGVLRRQHRLPSALELLDRARPIVEEIGGHQVLADFHAELSRCLEASGDAAGALAAARIAEVQRDNLRAGEAVMRAGEFDAERVAARHRTQLAERDRQQEAQDRALLVQRAELRARDAELARARTLRWSIAGGAVAGLLALGSVVYTQRVRLRAERLRLDETRRARAAAEEAAALKTQLLGIASHDLKAPLRGMLSRADLIAADVAPEGEAGRALRGLRGEGERMLRLVHDLLDVSAIEQGGLRLKFGSVDLADLVSGIVDGHRPLAALKNLELALALPAVPPARVRGDAARLGQAIANLVDNAVKFTPPGKAVRVALEAAPGHVSVVVRDEGPGLSPEDLARMFRPFQTASAVPTGGESSSGLGLHIAQEIVARHGGRIDVDSAPWGGATFAVVLPVAVAPGDSPPAGTPAAPGPAA